LLVLRHLIVANGAAIWPELHEPVSLAAPAPVAPTMPTAPEQQPNGNNENGKPAQVDPIAQARERALSVAKSNRLLRLKALSAMTDSLM
jgi:hypothetical protein